MGSRAEQAGEGEASSGPGPWGGARAHPGRLLGTAQRCVLRASRPAGSISLTNAGTNRPAGPRATQGRLSVHSAHLAQSLGPLVSRSHAPLSHSILLGPRARWPRGRTAVLTACTPASAAQRPPRAPSRTCCSCSAVSPRPPRKRCAGAGGGARGGDGRWLWAPDPCESQEAAPSPLSSTGHSTCGRRPDAVGSHPPSRGPGWGGPAGLSQGGVRG